MNLGSIVAKILRKTQDSQNPPTGWGGWLYTEEGKRWEALSGLVYDALDAARVNAQARRILFKGKKLTLNQAVQNLAKDLNEKPEAVRGHVLMWLQEASESDNEDRDDDNDVDYDAEIEQWIEQEGGIPPPII